MITPSSDLAEVTKLFALTKSHQLYGSVQVLTSMVPTGQVVQVVYRFKLSTDWCFDTNRIFETHLRTPLHRQKEIEPDIYKQFSTKHANKRVSDDMLRRQSVVNLYKDVVKQLSVKKFGKRIASSLGLDQTQMSYRNGNEETKPNNLQTTFATRNSFTTHRTHISQKSIV